jgi:hypothetical protein
MKKSSWLFLLLTIITIINPTISISQNINNNNNPYDSFSYSIYENEEFLGYQYPIKDGNWHNKCKELNQKEIEKIISQIKLQRSSIADLEECQTKSYKLFIELIKIDENNFEYAHKSIKSNRTFIIDFAKKHPDILNFINLNLKSDPIFF